MGLLPCVKKKNCGKTSNDNFTSQKTLITQTFISDIILETDQRLVRAATRIKADLQGTPTF